MISRYKRQFALPLVRIERIISCLFLLLWSFSVSATNYYVNSQKGDDKNKGTSPSAAIQSLVKVNGLRLNAGDRVLFKCGTTYTGQLKISGVGVPGNLLVIGSFGKGAKPLINGQGKFKAAVLLFNCAYVLIENLEITNTGVAIEAGRMGLHILLDNFGIAKETIVRNLYIHDVNGSNVKKDGGGAGIHWTNQGKQKLSAFDGLLIERCVLEKTDRNGITSSGYWSRQNWFPNYHIVIKYNQLKNIGGDGIVPIGCDGALIEHNIVTRAGQRFPEGDAAAGIWPWSCDRTVIQYNEVSYTAGPWDAQGFDSDWNCHNTIIQYNYSHHNMGGFLLVCNDGGVGMPASVGNTGTVVRYNVSINDGYRTTGKSAGFSPVIHITGPVKDTKIYNNLIFIPARNSAGMDSTLIEMGTWKGFADSTLVANNIFYVAGKAGHHLAGSTRNIFLSNVYAGSADNKGLPGEAIYVDPGFIRLPHKDPDGINNLKDFKLKAGSVLKAAGIIAVTSSVTDFYGNKVSPEKKPTIGVHQLN
jgi:hypothetical protein